MKHDAKSLRRAERHIKAALIKADMPGWQRDELEDALDCLRVNRKKKIQRDPAR